MNPRFLLRIASELLLLAWTFTLMVVLARAHAWDLAFLVLTMGVPVAALALAKLRATGALALAWHCPRLDRSGIRLGAQPAPWPLLLCAEELLFLLAVDARGFRGFLPDAQPEVVDAVRRAISLKGASASQERASIEHTLANIRSQLRFASAPPSDVASPVHLEGLHARAHALAAAVAENREGARS